MTTTAGTQSNPGDLLNTLIELTHDVCVAFEAAIDRTDNEGWLKGFHTILNDHNNQMAALRPYADRLSQNTSDSPDIKGLLNEGQVRLASLIGDKPLMGALCRIQNDMVVAYGRACQIDALPEPLKGLCARHLQQAQGHLQWLQAEKVDDATDGALAQKRSQDSDEVTVGRAVPHEIAQTGRIDQSTDY